MADEGEGRGGILAFGSCVACDRVIGFNPSRVPSYDGKPICEDCVVRVNKLRREMGNPPIIVYPDSYTIEVL